MKQQTWRTLRIIRFRSFPITRDTCWQSEPSLLVKSPTVSESKKDMSYKGYIQKIKWQCQHAVEWTWWILFKAKYLRFYEPEGEELSIIFPSVAWPGQHKSNYVINITRLEQEHSQNKELVIFKENFHQLKKCIYSLIWSQIIYLCQK